MGTDNPKVSAYVPQVLKERLKQFREERDISESQAVTIILAEYFQMPEALGRVLETTSVGGVTLARMEVLEKKLLDFATSVEHRLQQLEEGIRATSGLSSEPQIIEAAVEKADQPPASDQEPELGVAVDEKQENGLLSEPDNELPKPDTLSDEAGINSELEKDSGNTNIVRQPSVQYETVANNESRPELSLSGEPLNKLLSQPLPGRIMAKRLGYHPDSLSKVKSKNTDEAFIALSADRDVDNIAWTFVKKGRGYLPANELSSELQNKLLNWLKENFPEHSP